jgi:hypothetical protein
MKVAPVSEIPQHLARNVPHIYISRDPCRHIEFDVTLLGDCDSVVAELCRRTGWKLSHPMIKETQFDVTRDEDDGAGLWRIVPKGTEATAVSGTVTDAVDSAVASASASAGASVA